MGTTGSGPSVRIHGNISSLTRLFPQRLYKHLLRVRVEGGVGGWLPGGQRVVEGKEGENCKSGGKVINFGGIFNIFWGRIN